MNKLAQLLTDELDAMWHFALRLTANQADAEDLVQRTCLRALEKADDYREQGRVRSWLFQIEYRIWLNVLRSRKIRSAGTFKRRSPNEGLLDETAPDSLKIIDPEASGDHRELVNFHSPESELKLHQIYVQVESLPEAQRLVVLLVCVEGFTYQETAKILKIPIGTVMSRLARARIILGNAMLPRSTANSATEVDRGTQR